MKTAIPSMTEKPGPLEFNLTSQDISRGSDTYLRTMPNGRTLSRLLLWGTQYILLVISIWVASGHDSVLLWVVGTYSGLNVALLLTGLYFWARRRVRSELTKAWSVMYPTLPQSFSHEFDEKGIRLASNEMGELRVPWRWVMGVSVKDSDLYVQLPTFIQIPRSAFGDPKEATRMEQLMREAASAGNARQVINDYEHRRSDQSVGATADPPRS